MCQSHFLWLAAVRQSGKKKRTAMQLQKRDLYFCFDWEKVQDCLIPQDEQVAAPDSSHGGRGGRKKRNPPSSPPKQMYLFPPFLRFADHSNSFIVTCTEAFQGLSRPWR